MGKKDVISKIYLGAADRIADLLNNELFEGCSVVAGADIIELDSTAAKIASVYKGQYAPNRVISVINCVILNRRTSSTPQSSALYIDATER